MDYTLNLVLGEPIKFYDICTIYQPTIEDIMNIGIENYNKLLTPYIISKDILNIKNDEISDFDLLTLKLQDEDNKEIDILSLFIQSLMFFCREEVDIATNNSEFAFAFQKDLNKIINKDNFQEFSNIILKINNTKKLEKEKIPAKESDTRKKIRELIQKGRDKKNKKQDNNINLATIVNIVKFGMDSYIEKDKIKKMTIWELYQAYENIMNKENYKNNFEIFLVAGNENKELDMNHWSSKMLVREEL